VIVVDNGSTDGSVEFIAIEYPEVRTIALDSNRGFAAATNVGIRNAHSDYIALLNNDTEPDPRWLAELVACLERHPRAASATSKMLLYDQARMIDGVGDVMTWAFAPHPRGHRIPDRGQYEEECEVLSASGGAALWRADALRELGAFDEAFFFYYEDVDLGVRARLRGYECWYAPKSVVIHHRGATTPKGLSVFEVYYPIKNRWFMILKDTPGLLLARHLPAILYGDLHWWLRALRSGHLTAVVSAYGKVLRRLPRLLRQRREIQRGRRLANRDFELLLRPPPR
jgi:GT2 family glycosyltransferase